MLAAYICPDGQEVEIESCLKICRMGTRCMHKNILQYIANQRRPWNGVPSVTQLLNGTLQAYLEITNAYANNPDEYIYAIQGTAVHNLVEDDVPRIFSAKYGISGKPDSFDPGTGELTDFKNTGYYKVQLFLDGKENPYEWFSQVNMYRILLEEELGVKVNGMNIQCLIRDYSEHRLKNTKITRRTIIIPVPLIENETIVPYFMYKKQQLLSALETNNPTKCTSEERWYNEKTGKYVRCERYCPVRRICPYAEEREKGEKNVSGVTKVDS